MLVNDSYNHKEVNRKIIEAVGRPYGFIERFKMKGIGSPRLQISSACIEIEELLKLDNNADWCYIELRPDGIVLRFRSLLETFALVIPYWKMVLYKTDGEHYTLYNDHFFVRLKVKSKAEHNFVKRLMSLKAEKNPQELG